MNKEGMKKKQPDSSTAFVMLTAICFPHSVLTLCHQRYETRDLGRAFQNSRTLMGS